MCRRCNYPEMLSRSGVEPTPLREAVFRSIGDESRPLSAVEIMQTVQKRMSLNKVTVYRILDLLVGNGLVKRLSAGDRAYRYGMADSSNHPEHPHFVCSQCGRMECLRPEVFAMDIKQCRQKTKRMVRRVDVRLEGICERCLGDDR